MSNPVFAVVEDSPYGVSVTLHTSKDAALKTVDTIATHNYLLDREDGGVDNLSHTIDFNDVHGSPWKFTIVLTTLPDGARYV